MDTSKTLALVSAVVALTLGVTACTVREDGLREATWATLAWSPDSREPRELMPTEGGLGRVPLSDVEVSLVGCYPHDQRLTAGDCFFGIELLEEKGLYVEAEDVAELTATATLIFRAEQLTPFQEGKADDEVLALGEFGSVEVGPLRFGETAEVKFGGGGASDPVTQMFTLADDPTVIYRIWVDVIDCRISNGSACGNGKHPSVYSYLRRNAEDLTIGTSQSGLDAEQSDFVLPDTLGDLQGSPSLFQREGESDLDFEARQDAETGHLADVADELGLQELVAARYIGGAQEHTVLGVHPPHNVLLHAGRHSEPMSQADLAEEAVSLLERAFASIYQPDDGSDIAFDSVRTHDVGIACAIRTLTTPTAVLQSPVCGWVDDETIGVVEGPMIIEGAVPSAEQAEDQTARLIAELRSAVRLQGGAPDS